MGLVMTFFSDVNWRYGVPQEWFLDSCDQMWNALEGHRDRNMQINPHWLCLLYSVLALTPRNNTLPTPGWEASAVRVEHYFLYALTARRLAEDAYMTNPSFSPQESAADGTVLGCLGELCTLLYHMRHRVQSDYSQPSR